MAEIAAFKALIYNQEKIKDLSQVTCPPYDVIPPERQESYRRLSHYNFIHILLSQGSGNKDKYAEAAFLFDHWIKKGIFVLEEKPALYFYVQDYLVRGEKKTRLGFICLLNLGESNFQAYGHENTHLTAKEDRLRLLQATKANLSPLFMLFTDRKRLIQRLYEGEVQRQACFVDILDDDRVRHRLWRIDAPEVHAEVSAAMSAEKIFIADGHHRFEVACAYRQEMRERLGNLSGKESFNYTLAYFTGVEQRGLTILPIHRLLKFPGGVSTDEFLRKIGDYFEVEPIREVRQFFYRLEKAGQTGHVTGMYKDKKYWLFRLKNIKILKGALSDKSPEYRKLDVSLLNCLVFKEGLGLVDQEGILFDNDAESLIRRVDNDGSLAAFFLNPAKIQQVIEVALSGSKMPPKTTYFYPKLLSGLIIHKHEDY